jgi:hypothetical protein
MFAWEDEGATLTPQFVPSLGISIKKSRCFRIIFRATFGKETEDQVGSYDKIEGEAAQW